MNHNEQGVHPLESQAVDDSLGQSAIDSAQNDQTLVLQSILATKQANIEKIRHLSPGQKDQLGKGNISCETWSSTNGDVNPLR